MESYKKDKHQLFDQKDGKSLTEESNITNSIQQDYQILTEQLRIAETTKSWKLMCLLRRINEQLFKGNFTEKKKFFQWIKNKILKKPVIKELELAKFSPIKMESIHFEKELSLSKKCNLTFLKLIKSAHRIADLGSGSGSFWWDRLPEDIIVDAYDLYNKPSKSLPNINFYSLDCTELYKHSELQEKYDIVVADHVFEHVATPEQFADSINFILKPGGYLHVGIPDASNFTDRLYRLIHRNGGGHIQQYTRDSFISFMASFGFILKELSPWPDDWLWLEKCFDIEYHGIEYFTYEEKKYIADVFRKELVPEKGYLYGWEYLFIKKI